MKYIFYIFVLSASFLFFIGYYLGRTALGTDSISHLNSTQLERKIDSMKQEKTLIIEKLNQVEHQKKETEKNLKAAFKEIARLKEKEDSLKLLVIFNQKLKIKIEKIGSKLAKTENLLSDYSNKYIDIQDINKILQEELANCESELGSFEYILEIINGRWIAPAIIILLIVIGVSIKNHQIS